MWVENPMGIIIEHGAVYGFYKNYFDYLWNIAKTNYSEFIPNFMKLPCKAHVIIPNVIPIMIDRINDFIKVKLLRLISNIILDIEILNVEVRKIVKMK